MKLKKKKKKLRNLQGSPIINTLSKPSPNWGLRGTINVNSTQRIFKRDQNRQNNIARSWNEIGNLIANRSRKEITGITIARKNNTWNILTLLSFLKWSSDLANARQQERQCPDFPQAKQVPIIGRRGAKTGTLMPDWMGLCRDWELGDKTRSANRRSVSCWKPLKKPSSCD